MIRIQTFVFNSFQVNTYLLINENNEGILIDGANYENSEDETLSQYIESNNIKIKRHLLTHAHVDHILGSYFIEKKWGVLPETHSDSLYFLESAEEFASVFGLGIKKASQPVVMHKDDDTIPFGDSEIKVLHTPGHANGSLCYFLPKETILFSGDVLFAGSVGRTDLPTGSMDTLIKSIREKLLILPEETEVFPGHGPSTTISIEKRSNPFF